MSKPIRVLHCLIGSMNVGGIENMLMQMYRCIDKEKVQFDFLVHDYNENYYEKEIKELGGKIYRIPYVSKKPFEHIKQFKALLQNHPEYRIIHIHTTYSIMITDAKEAKKMGRTVIIHSHNTDAPLKRKLIHKLLKNRFSKYADYKVACSKIAGEWLFPAKCYDSVMFWPNAKQLEKYKFSEDIRKKIRREEVLNEAFIIGNIGRLSYQKNQELLIEVFLEILREKPNAVLWLVGDGEDREKLENIINKRGIEDKVKFWGNVDNVNELLFAMDVFVLTSRYEGLPVVLVEAQATGIPLVIPHYIAKETCVQKEIYFINEPLNKSEWKNKILKINTNRERKDCYNLISESDFNIYNWVNKVEKFYLNIEKEHL